MGSKRMMLQNGFGSAILDESRRSERVVDLFSGSGAVAWYAAERIDQPVFAVDLQSYSAVLASAVIARTTKLNMEKVESEWLRPALRSAHRCKPWSEAKKHDQPRFKYEVTAARQLCATESAGVVWQAYGGHYFSPRQALLMDRALLSLPQREPLRSACKAALIASATYCAASPGHTAQPFQPTQSAMPFIREAWGRDPLAYARTWLSFIAERHARKKGRVKIADAVAEASELRESDLVVVDPPYSAVQYSRFYHVLEAIAKAGSPLKSGVSGSGRYPPIGLRPHSDFSLKTKSADAVEDLLKALGGVGCRVLITFPESRCSNGLSGHEIAELAEEHFNVTTKTVAGRFSTLGGNNDNRAARQASAEMIMTLTPLGR